VAYLSEVVGTEEAFEKSLRLLESAPRGGLMSVDTETNGFSPRLGARVTLVSLAWRDQERVGHAVALPFGQGQGREQIWATREAWMLVMEKLSVNDLVMFNAPFDHRMLRAGTQRDMGMDLGRQVHWCTLEAEKVLIGGSTGGLKATGERYQLTGGTERDGETVILNWLRAHGLGKGDIHKVPWGVIQPYARNDAVMPLLLYEAQQAQLAQLPESVRARVEAKMKVLRKKLSGEPQIEIDLTVT
jgi:hypothetical protein